MPKKSKPCKKEFTNNSKRFFPFDEIKDLLDTKKRFESEEIIQMNDERKVKRDDFSPRSDKDTNSPLMIITRSILS